MGMGGGGMEDTKQKTGNYKDDLKTSRREEVTRKHSCSWELYCSREFPHSDFIQ